MYKRTHPIAMLERFRCKTELSSWPPRYLVYGFVVLTANDIKDITDDLQTFIEMTYP